MLLPWVECLLSMTLLQGQWVAARAAGRGRGRTHGRLGGGTPRFSTSPLGAEGKAVEVVNCVESA